MPPSLLLVPVELGDVIEIMSVQMSFEPAKIGFDVCFARVAFVRPELLGAQLPDYPHPSGILFCDLFFSG